MALGWPRSRVRAAEPLEPDERVMFLPSTARLLDDGRIEAEVHAWVYEPDHLRGLNTAFARYLGLRLSKMSPAAQLRFRQRAALFHAESEDGKQIDVVFGRGQAPLRLPPTDRAGRTQARVVVTPAPDALADAPWLRFRAEMPRGDLRRSEGRVLLVPHEGLSVVSDIDDTIKHTAVRSRREMLLNTFARPFEAAPGMAAHYRRLARVTDTRFHYLSASPIQLFPALADFVRSAGFPPGSMHLRESTTWRTLVPGEQDSRRHKLGTIERLLADFPLRRFLLVGDSGEADPEIYGQVARDHAARVEAVVIRDVTGEGRDAVRYQSAFEGVAPGRWHLLPRDGSRWPLPLP
ncbi:MAG: App1 family protein [Proteobacteria bacterium]|nr:App1 family protein [Pseudomonadota bacterium]